MSMSFLKPLVRGAFRRRGFAIHKYPTCAFQPLPVFDLAVRFLMATRGPGLTFIQVGANDGRFGDPLYKYVTAFPWRGILIEPQPDVFARLCESYAAHKERLIFENIAIAGSATKLAMYRERNAERSNNSAPASTVVSSDPQIVARQLGVSRSELEQIFVDCMTLDDLVAKHRISSLDVLQIDAEGFDYDVLRTLSLDRLHPAVIQFEHGHLSPRQITKAVEYLSGNGYSVLFGGNQTDTLALYRSVLADKN